MFNSTQPAQQARPTTNISQPNEKCETAHNWADAQHCAQCYSLSNWISHWCKVSLDNSDARWPTLDITGAG